MVLESDSKECKPKNNPAIPNAAKIEDPSFCPCIARSVPAAEVWRVDRITARMARIKPTPFHPPFSACVIGQIGLLVCQANLTTVDAISPTVHADIFDSKRPGCPHAEYQVAAHDRLDMETENPTINSLDTGSVT
jgi:hypothetical protein